MRNNFKALGKVEQGSTKNELQNCMVVSYWLEDHGRLFTFQDFLVLISHLFQCYHEMEDSLHLCLLSKLGCIFSTETVGDANNYSKLFLLKTLNSLTSTFPCILSANQVSLCLVC